MKFIINPWSGKYGVSQFLLGKGSLEDEGDFVVMRYSFWNARAVSVDFDAGRTLTYWKRPEWFASSIEGRTDKDVLLCMFDATWSGVHKGAFLIDGDVVRVVKRSSSVGAPRPLKRATIHTVMHETKALFEFGISNSHRVVLEADLPGDRVFQYTAVCVACWYRELAMLS